MSTVEPTIRPIPGWYNAPDGAPQQRFWDGENWTEHFRAFDTPNIPAPVAAAPASEGAGALVIVSYILAVFMPIIGLILGIVVVTRPGKAQSKHGIWVILVSVLAFIAWFAIISSHSSTPTYTSY